MARALIYCAVGLLSLTTLVVVGADEEPWSDMLAGTVLAVLLFFFDRAATADWSRAKLAVVAATKYRNELIRVSIAYLIRVKVDGEFLLVESTRRAGQYQPIGGVFKRLPEAVTTLHSLEVLDDDCVPIDEGSRGDLRVRVKGKHLLALLDWYESGQDRETDTWREFYEELIRPGILSAPTFPYLLFRKVRHCRTAIHYTPYFQCQEVRIAEVVEPLLNSAQEEEIRALRDGKSSGYMWANETKIRGRGVDVARQEFVANIGKHTEWIL